MDDEIPIMADPMIGRILGGCVIEEHLGTGATGSVYRARQISLDRRLAIKILHPHIALHEVVVNRFAREARAAAKLQHPNLVQIFDFGQEDDLYFYTMELVDGASLGDYLKAGRAFDEPWCRHIARQAISALDLAHGAGIIHRDVKPDNMILDSKGILKISDLGLARIRLDDEQQSLTMTGDTLGTPYYMSPEQVQDSRLVDFRSDYYSLGVTLYHLAVGRPPFEGETRFSVMSAHVNAPPPDARDSNPAVSKGFSSLILWLMQKKPEDRPGSAAEVIAALDALDRDEAPVIPPRPLFNGKAGAASKTGNKGGFSPGRAVLIAAEILLLALLAIGAFFLHNHRSIESGRQTSGFNQNPAEKGIAPDYGVEVPPPSPAAPPFPQAPQIVIQPPSAPSIALTMLGVESLTRPVLVPSAPPVEPARRPGGKEEFFQTDLSREPGGSHRRTPPASRAILDLASPEFFSKQKAAYSQAADDRRLEAERSGMRLINLYELSPPAIVFDAPMPDEAPAVLTSASPLVIRPEWPPSNQAARILLSDLARNESFKASLILSGLVVVGYGSVDVFTAPLNAAPEIVRNSKRRVATVQVGPGRSQLFSFPVTEPVRKAIESGTAEEFRIFLVGNAEILLGPDAALNPPFAPRLELQFKRPGIVPQRGR